MRKNCEVTNVYWHLLLLVFRFFFAACSYNTGNKNLQKETAASIDSKIHDGVTTKEQIRAMFGEPTGTSIENGHVTWTYTFNSIRLSALDFVIPVANSTDRSRTLTVTFNGDVVKSHSVSDSNAKSNTGL